MDHPRRDREDHRDHLRHTTCKDHRGKDLPDHPSTCSNIRQAPRVTQVNTPDNTPGHQVVRNKDLHPVHLTDHPTRVLPKVHPACRPEWSPAPDTLPTRWHQTRVHRRQDRCSREVPAVPAREWPAQEVPTWADQVVQI